MNKLESRIETALRISEEKQFATDYLDIIREALNVADGRLIKLSGTMIVLIATFEFIARAAIAEASFGGLKVTDLSLIQKLLPVLVAFLASRLVAITAVRAILLAAYNEMFRRIAPKMYENHLEALSFPPSFSAELLLGRFSSSKTAVDVVGFITVGGILLLIVGPLAFECYAYFRNFVAFGYSDVTIWLTLLIVLLLSFQGAAYGWGVTKVFTDTDEQPPPTS
jgi:hypothetical protein